MSLDTDTKLGKYELRHVLGKGAKGTVHEGFDTIIARQVAIKTIRLPEPDDHEAQEELARFKREAQAAGRLSHPNIVGVFDYGETPELAYIVMEFVNGTTLKHVMSKKEPFELNKVVRVMESLLAGLQYSHDRGVVHRDIKPANIMLTKSGDVKIADFGIARIESSSLTQAGTVLGTPAYMSPEQFMGETVDSRSDLYSAGVMLYQMLTGEKPFEGGMTAIMHKVLNTKPPLPSSRSANVPQHFDAVVSKAMAKLPEDRYASASDFAKAIRDAYAGNDAMPEADLDFGFDFGIVDAASYDVAAMATTTWSLPIHRVQSVPVKKRAPVSMMVGAAVVVLAGGGYFLLGGKSSSAATLALTTPVAVQAPYIAAAEPKVNAGACDTDAAYDQSSQCMPAVASTDSSGAIYQQANVAPAQVAAAPQGGPWGIQVGAFASAGLARMVAEGARAQAPEWLGEAGVALPATIPSGGNLLYQARLTNLSQNEATNACAALNHRQVTCVIVQASNSWAELPNGPDL